MVDFKKHIGKKVTEKNIHPCEIYDTLDRASDKGPLRPVQKVILNNWFDNFQDEKDVILKLHTGQGKTLIGLLILQSRLNQETGPALYLCPDNYLVDQTRVQAESFGIHYTTIKSDNELPDDFLEGKKILITNVSKLFNGETKFKLEPKSLKISSILMDDAHACINYIKDSCKITLRKEQVLYNEFLTLFGPELEKQGAGTYADIRNGDYDSFLAVPYWDWQDKHTEVVKILSENKTLQEIKFAWPILKDNIKECKCIISGNGLEIIPYIIPLHLFGSYYKANHRVFMSATINDDSFFIKGLGINANTIENPLYIKDEKWSGEKMILIPSLIDNSLNRTEVVNVFSKSRADRKFGTVVLAPSFKGCQDWEKYGSKIATKDTIIQEIEKLKNRDCEKTLVIVNRYDGIDLPDHSCRILIFDSKPNSESLEDRYLENCRSDSEIISTKLAQIIEQGLGRAVRGEKDYCAILLIGVELVKILRGNETRKYFSQQTRTQVEIGFQIAEFAKDEMKTSTPINTLINIINQLLKRDDDWKEFYTEQMDAMPKEEPKKKVLSIFEKERQADIKYQDSNYIESVKIIQKIIDELIESEEEKGWYLQEIARIIYPYSISESNNYQVQAHKRNRYLFKPKEGMIITKISTISLKRIENIILWIQTFNNYEELKINLDSILGHLRFGVEADRFEKALDDLGTALGFVTQRPDKTWNEGPDNLWKIKDNHYLLVECKSKVLITRKEITKDETGQMNNACAWFTRNYGDAPVKRIIIIPTKKLSHASGFNLDVEIMRESNLKKLTHNVEKFFMELKELDFKDLPVKRIQEFLGIHQLNAEEILSLYSEEPKE